MRDASLWRVLRLTLAALVLAALAACGSRVTLYAATNETEANELISALLDAGIAADKVAGKEGVAVSVEGDQVARALNVLRAQGLPRERFDGMGQIFRKEGLVSSPLEERARYLYALSQELGNTLSQIDGVLTARVHVVLPERGGVGEAATPSTAAVFIKYKAGYTLDALQPQIRKLVTHAISGLSEDRVSITLVPAQPGDAESAPPPPLLTSVLGFQVDGGSATGLIALLTALIVLALALAAALGWMLWRNGLPFASAKNGERREPALAADAGKAASP